MSVTIIKDLGKAVREAQRTSNTVDVPVSGPDQSQEHQDPVATPPAPVIGTDPIGTIPPDSREVRE